MSNLMTLGSYGFLPTRSLLDNFDSVIDTLVGETRDTFRTHVSVPRVNIEESSEGYTIHLAAPGLSREDFKIHTDTGFLTVSVDQKSEKSGKEKWVCREFSYSAFSRTWKLPAGVNSDTISARYHAGILTVTVPVSAKKASRTSINVE